jgi:hypothetical protein
MLKAGGGLANSAANIAAFGCHNFQSSAELSRPCSISASKAFEGWSAFSGSYSLWIEMRGPFFERLLSCPLSLLPPSTPRPSAPELRPNVSSWRR